MSSSCMVLAYVKACKAFFAHFFHVLEHVNHYWHLEIYDIVNKTKNE